MGRRRIDRYVKRVKIVKNQRSDGSVPPGGVAVWQEIVTVASCVGGVGVCLVDVLPHSLSVTLPTGERFEQVEICENPVLGEGDGNTVRLFRRPSLHGSTLVVAVNLMEDK